MDSAFHLTVRVGVAICMGVAIALATSLIGWKGSAAVADNVIRLHYNPPMRIVGWVTLVAAFCFPAVVILLVLFFPPPSLAQVFGAAGIALAILVGGLYVAREIRRGHVTITPEGVELFSPWWGAKSMQWSRVNKAELGPVGWVVLSGMDGSTLTFRPTHWAGIDDLEKAVRQYVAKSAIVTKSLQ